MSLSEERNSIANGRLGAPIRPGAIREEVLEHLRVLAGRVLCGCDAPDISFSAQVPVELRTYERPGAGMSWHRDDILYGPRPQIEVVFTLENSSDCVTMWKEKSAGAVPGGSEETVHRSAETEPNSAIFIRAGSVEHCVSSLRRGTRVILKMVFVHGESELLPGS
eukprot:CAMPEP_0194343486 /NCGR_PEP_ID=MMETSP0171-20130528/97227_1 /TAXON_ID=218684 /ORGANISM="Corethron pennatum, Strain L29A3" /LENGTH=164 /DNA_ID=CAMNT_0039109727 /DNA_START=494 /DNA_END=984 /DNA_ORIENTATION=+